MGAPPSPDNAPVDVRTGALLHQLRTPLNQIIGYSELLAEQAEEEGQSRFVPDLQKIQRAGQQLLTLLQGLGAPQIEVEGKTPDAATQLKPAPGASAANAQPDPSPGDGQRALILVVDDIETNREVLSRRLERLGHGVAMADDGRQALEMVRSRACDLVLLDIMMPEMDGYEALRQLKADEALRHIPVIMISAVDELESVVRCIEMGAADYLPKPFNPTLLKARVGACLQQKRAHDQEALHHQELQASYQRLQQLEKLRDDLTNMIVHDLRTPLTAVLGGIQTVEIAGPLNEMQQEMVGIATRGGETLLDMINDLLDVEKLESGTMKLDYAVLEATEIVSSAALQVGALLDDQKLTLVRTIEADLPPFVGDAKKLRRVLVNLLGNSIKFTPTGGTVTVDARRAEDPNQLVFAVSDTGEGIPTEAFDRIFEKFGQVESRRGGRVMSTGLGLAFCQLAIKAHGGHIRVESVLGEGSTFSFTIPLVAPAAPAHS